jgi:hypothetical protein
MAIFHLLLPFPTYLFEVAADCGHHCHASGASLVPKLLRATPSLLAALYYVSAPFFSRMTRQRYVDHAEKVGREWQGSVANIPPHLDPKIIAENIDWVIDAPQVVPTLLLPLATAVFAIRDSAVASIVLAFSSIGISIFALWMYSKSPVEYRSLRIPTTKHTIVAVLGIVLNISAALLLIFL